MSTPAPLPDQPARWCVLGVLLDKARVGVSPAGLVSLQVLIVQRLARQPEARPVLARRVFGQGNTTAAQYAAHHQAGQLLPGREVLVVGSCLHPGLYRGQPVLVLDDVTSIELHTPERLSHAA